ncbi:substrate-binding periplasmic protein [Pseudomonas sp. LRF_L74]|uniref:substrate-binding periplasmic protein n=1 Tax=Pseudomonas sp. LRF_L74 TaxID=3369422 RepID=UPI003F62A619
MPDLCRTGPWPALLSAMLALSLCLGLACARADTIRIGAEDDWYPYTGVKDGEVSGMSADIVRAAFAAAAVDVELVPYPYARCMEMVRVGQLPACFNTAPNERISREFRLSEAPLFTDDILLWARKADARPITALDQLGSRRVAVTIGYEYGALFDEHPGINRIQVRRDLNGFLMLLHRRVDFTAAYRGTAQALFLENPELAGQFAPVATLHHSQLYLSASRHNADAEQLLQHFDQGMRTIRGNGQYQQILDYWQRYPEH